MYFGPLDLEACAENNFTINSLGLLASRPDLRQRFVERLCGELKPADASITMRFFSRIGEGFFREAIERAGAGYELAKLERRLNRAVEFPENFKWARNKLGKLIQPAKWSKPQIQAVFNENGRGGDRRLEERLDFIQDFLNTEPDIVLQWGKQLAIVEIKVLAAEGPTELQRQRCLASPLGGLLGWNVHFFYIGPEWGAQPSISEYTFVSWAKVAILFNDVPEIADYINNLAFFYRGG